MDTSELYRKGFGYVGFYSQCPTQIQRYRTTVRELSALARKLDSKQYCYTDSEATLRCIVARLSGYGTVRAYQLTFNSWIVAWAKASPKIDSRRVLYTDAEGKEHDWS